MFTELACWGNMHLSLNLHFYSSTTNPQMSFLSFNIWLKFNELNKISPPTCMIGRATFPLFSTSEQPFSTNFMYNMTKLSISWFLLGKLLVYNCGHLDFNSGFKIYFGPISFEILFILRTNYFAYKMVKSHKIWWNIYSLYSFVFLGHRWCQQPIN